MKFVTLQEYNQKEHETFIFFLQYTGNEEAINNLSYFIKNADTDDLYGDYSKFQIDNTTLLSQSTVDELNNVNIGTFGPLFTVCKGRVIFNKREFDNLNSSELGFKLDELYYACRISDYFIQEDIQRQQIFYEKMLS